MLKRLLCQCLTLFALAAPAAAFETRATAAWVYDMATQTVLMDKNADQALPPASMSKLMTLNMLFEALRDGRVTMDTEFTVSARAKAMGGSTMFLNERDRPTARDLIHGIIINSGNDACVVVAEGLSGTEEAFSKQMTARGQALGMTNSNFANSSGWPDPNHRMSMRDLGILAKRLIEEFPEYYPIFAETEFNFGDRAASNRHNRNPLLKLGGGADGLKTGHTAEAGYGLVGSAKQGDRRVIFVITGLDTDAARAEESDRMMNWAFRQFVLKTVIKSGQRVADADVWLGNTASVGLVAAQDVTMLVPASVQDGVKAQVNYTGPLRAPFAPGTPVGTLTISVPDLPDRQIPLITETGADAAGFMQRIQKAASILRTRLADDAEPAT
ncbi:D-alanyl-D-alanine carboxypeptidase (penicillin-binding protein 5/6) [Pseudorhodobacter antarcticus]|jgi:D-alanyl-D-alanine carboxypeptidase (penicillin-binding protein 5/6)|uniref:serine-type D-Ala-D-Ala carboxypeptidase n=1 Tax=Pseudorhodobacter antarcticus TaxID=1077947 RepID=A0A1H8FUB6_9RHOB|nr:D-alanyl-D-alanine carboxypeptidase family protein [Pseudorhodobacter antarcticus]SEN35306.1 D-alanyl-D-alanine carboxypeptidase (penicillin-binding protein 5/6) [Pseudorhodobacter antarcticus]